MYIAHVITKLWRRVVTEVAVELQIFLEKWKLLLAGLIFQYIHGLAAHGVHYLHRPAPVLHDLGFNILPELGKEKFYISETLFSIIFILFILSQGLIQACRLLLQGCTLAYTSVFFNNVVSNATFWTFHPFICKNKRFYTVLLWCRILAFLVASQFLRIITFYSTQLPGPSYHCREGSKIATLPPPKNIREVLLINFPHGVIYGCGDLIFSSHMIFTLVFIRTYHKYGTKRFIKALAWLMAIAQSLLIIASHKHYSVDIVVAWYAVNLVVFFIDKKLPEMPDRTGSTGSLLPLSNKEKDKTKEEDHKLLNGNSNDTSDWRQRSQVNGKHPENGNHLVSEAT